MTRGLLSRRAALAGAAAVLAAPAGAAALKPLRVAALDWALAATSLSIGLVPVGVAEQRLYRRWVADPVMPPGVVELGLRAAPSLEGLAQLRPDLILVNALDEPLRPTLDRIAPTLSLAIYGDARRPLALARDTVRDLGRRAGREPEAEALIAVSDAAFAEGRTGLGGLAPRPVLAFGFVDARTLRIYGSGSLFADVLARLGFASAWRGPTSPWGTATAGVAALADVPDAILIAVEPIPDDARAALAAPGLLHALTAARTLRILPAVWPYGELSAARRFADLVTAALAPAPEAAHAG